MEEKLLLCLRDILKENQFETELLEAKEGQNPMILRIESKRNGKVMQDVLYELCFIPLKLPRENTALLQFYVTLFTGLMDNYFYEVSKACDYCNSFSAIGSFGLFRPAGQLYLKQNVVLDLTDSLEKLANQAVDNLSLLMASVAKFIDPLAAIGNGATTLELAKESDMLPQM